MLRVIVYRLLAEVDIWLMKAYFRARNKLVRAFFFYTCVFIEYVGEFVARFRWKR